MCRLLGIVSNVKTEPEIFESFREQCITGCVKASHREPGHLDGWGLGFLKDGRMEVVKSGKDARSDKLYEETYPLIVQRRRRAAIRSKTVRRSPESVPLH